MSLSQQGTHRHFDALVIGTGLSGLMFCLELIKRKPEIKIALITKSTIAECSSFYAQGGIAASRDQDCPHHIADTVKAGDGLCVNKNVEDIIFSGSETIKNLINYQIPFDKDGHTYAKAKEGGHSTRRIYHCGDATGRSMVLNLIEQIKNLKQIHCFEYHSAINLIKAPPEHTIKNYGEVQGSYVLDEKANKIHAFCASVTVLATGGAGKVFRYTTNPEVATGDGLAMAYRAGARVGNMEFYQFHPTLLHHPTLNNFLISEALRGEGAILRNGDTLKPFMANYAPEEKDLATRDVVSRAIFNEIECAKADFVYLDITHHSNAFLEKRFPTISSTLKSIGINIANDFIPVVPAAHYQCGGVLTNTFGETCLERLFAIGEVAFTGFHGANRLASNSLLEAAVMAEKSAIVAEKILTQSPTAIDNKSVPSWESGNAINLRRASQINAHWRGLRGEMTSYAGIVRTEAGLKDLLSLTKTRKKLIEEYYWQHQITRDFIELRNIVLVAELIVTSALMRRESRGGHYREDYPLQSDTPTPTLFNFTPSK